MVLDSGFFILEREKKIRKDGKKRSKVKPPKEQVVQAPEG